MANKQGLIDYLSRAGKTNRDSWVDLALMFGFPDGERARKTWLKHRKSESGQFCGGYTGSEEPKYNVVRDTPAGYTVATDSYKQGIDLSTYAHMNTYKILNNPVVTTTGFIPPPPTREDILETIVKTVKETVTGSTIEDLLNFRRAIDSGKQGKYLLELAVFDVHIGKLATMEESGEDYNVDIAVRRYTDAIINLLKRTDPRTIDRILLPIGNDFIHIDSKSNMTTAGTPQDCATRYTNMVVAGKKLLIDTINKLSLLAPVDVVVIHGNHDTHTMFAIGEMLSAYYHSDNKVTINNEPTQRKYYTYHSTAIQFTHGNEEKHTDLPLIFASEKPQLWGLAKHRYCQLGHYHKSKKMNYVSTNGLNGVEIQILPSLSGNDAWHTSKGYTAPKQAKAFLFDKEDGLISEFTYHG